MIKLFLTDLDGCLTDGGYYVTSVLTHPKEQFLRKFNTRDFVGITMLRDAGIKISVVTGSEQPSQQQFDRWDSGIQVCAGVQDKYEFIRTLFIETTSEGNTVSRKSFSWEEVAFVGDEINDARLLEAVGWAACPADAVPEIIDIVKKHRNGTVLSRKGGDTCVREFTDLICKEQNITVSWCNWTKG